MLSSKNAKSFVQALFCVQPITKEGVKPSVFIP